MSHRPSTQWQVSGWEEQSQEKMLEASHSTSAVSTTSSCRGGKGEGATLSSQLPWEQTQEASGLAEHLSILRQS